MDDRSPEPEENAPPAPARAQPDLPPFAPLSDTDRSPESSRTPFAPWSTALWSVALAVATGFLFFSISSINRDQLIERPEAYLDRVVGRDLDAAEDAGRMPAWEKLLNFWQVATREEALNDGIKLYQQFKAEGTFDDTARIQKTLAILLAEAGRLEEARQELSPPAEDKATLEFRAAFESAYAPDPGTTLPPTGLGAVQGVTPEWARDKFAGRLAQRRGDEAAVRRAEERCQRRGAHLQRRATIISALSLVLVGSGLSVIAIWLRRRSPLAIAQGNPVGPWPLADGYAVLVRGATGGVILAGSLAYLSTYLAVAAGFATLLSAIPLFLLTARFLIRPGFQTFSEGFGLVLNPGNGRRLLLTTLAVAALMMVGEAALAEITSHWQDNSLAESIPEEFLFGSWSEVLFSALDAIVWAPLFEEIAFRGLLYASLRRRLGMGSAAAVSSVIFGLVHGYSFQGLLVIFWSGFVWALAYEKTRSLWPGILCHAMSNTLAVATPILLYRL